MLYTILNENAEIFDILDLEDEDKKAFEKANPNFKLVESVGDNPLEEFDPNLYNEEDFFD